MPHAVDGSMPHAVDGSMPHAVDAGFPRSWKSHGKWLVMEKSWKSHGKLLVMEKSWNSVGHGKSHGKPKFGQIYFVDFVELRAL